jgi:2'-5' RNA ligase
MDRTTRQEEETADSATARRCFVACFLGAESAAAVAAQIPELPDCRRVPAPNLHVTLHFIGALEADRAAELAAFTRGLSGTATEASIVDVRRLPLRRPRLLVAVLDVDPLLEQWRAALLAGWPTAETRRDFLPHVTVVRFSRAPAAAAAALGNLVGNRVDLEPPAVYVSDTRPEGARYQPLR